MNSTITSTTRAGIAATTFAALALAATACGTEAGSADASAKAASVSQAAPQQETRISPRTAERQAELQAQIRKLLALEADAKRWARGHDTGEIPCRPLRRTAKATTCAIPAP
ncbi:MAG TPA: hypothetical protein PLZ93_13875 [Nocardioides sp.]|uniref:hypothetical protein n=1 Tax=uncultured Nocardioides sp. TaxID=198441 RepID=UPI000EC08377|nr:hypothetical protein [uncultured Nocardioides sp.]HCB05411.1 hypothetical protein [Nocardioides sp.]HRI96699.1 hypothetical protein [Nocardioides sp.]